MAMNKIIVEVLCVAIVDAFIISNDNNAKISAEIYSDNNLDTKESVKDDIAANAFNGVYTECFLHLSYLCLQKKTLLYLKELNNLKEISVIGNYVKFVKLNTSQDKDVDVLQKTQEGKSSEELSLLIDEAVNIFFDNHKLRFSALGKDVLMQNKVEEFIGRKKRKGGGGGDGDHDGGKKKFMMMAMMCMKMKLMMMIPAMMGMMGMMSFKGMMFSMMSFMVSKMVLLMKILEKKGGGGGGGGDGSWNAGGGGGAWIPAGGQDYGGGGGGYDANGQWQSRSILETASENTETIKKDNKPMISYIKPIIRYNNNANTRKPFVLLKNLNDEIVKIHQSVELDADKPKSRKKRGIIDVLQNAYRYWINNVLGVQNNKIHPNHPKYKVFNGVKYIYHPIKQTQKPKFPKPQTHNHIKSPEELKTIIRVEDFNKGEIMEGPVEGRLNRKKFHKMKDTVNETVDENPWE